MSVAFAEPVLDRSPDVERAGGPARVGTKVRRPGPGTGPTARPRRLRFTAPAVAGAGAAPRACGSPAAPGPRTWRLTERGLAVVLVVAAVLVASSLAVVGLTALRVTGETYRPSHGAVAPVLVQP